jgi:hypothetical protein
MRPIRTNENVSPCGIAGNYLFVCLSTFAVISTHDLRVIRSPPAQLQYLQLNPSPARKACSASDSDSTENHTACAQAEPGELTKPDFSAAAQVQLAQRFLE